MADRIVQIDEGFWNVRGSFKLKGLIEIGTQTSLARLASGGFAILDAYTLTGEVAREVMELTDQGRAVEYILNLHPFHTIHVEAKARMFPGAKLYGTARHVAKAPDLPWQSLHTDDPELHAQLAQDFDFMVPRGVDFISKNENLHFSSVLAIHKASQTLHVDDTLMWTNLPLVGGLSFHMTLKSVLLRRPAAGAEFRAWAMELAQRCETVKHLCTSHMRALPPPEEREANLAADVRQALAKVEKILIAHDQRHTDQ